MFPFRRRTPQNATPLDRAFAYHEATKHHFDRYAAALGYLDWATQPAPFRRYADAEILALPKRVAAAPLAYDRLYDGAAIPPSTFDLATLADLLRHALAVSAWKRLQTSRWALRVNPSSGNLHPTESYLVLGAHPDWGDGGVFHYAPDLHALERRARVAPATFAAALPTLPNGCCLIGLSSIVWREAWKYGERAFRYCQHDLGHAWAALQLAARLHGFELHVLTDWSGPAQAALLGLDRDADFAPPEREEPELLALLCPSGAACAIAAPAPTALQAWRQSDFSGRGNQLSREHHPWPILAEIAAATQWQGHPTAPPQLAATPRIDAPTVGPLDARAIVQQRRSAVAMDGQSSIALADFARLLHRTLPLDRAPFDNWPWPPQVHLALFVHRVRDLAPGLYMLVRDPRDHAATLADLRAKCRSEFAWQPAGLDDLPLYLLQRGDERDTARAISCHQEIAADGFFSLGMLARFAPTLRERGADFYRPLFWETGAIGQVLYLEAEAAGARATGIGCFFDDALHDSLGLRDADYQCLYHFTVGMPVDDPRLTTEPGYPDP